MKALDVFPKTRAELSERTLSGALISIASLLFICWAAVHEIWDCWRVVTDNRLVPQFTDTHAGALTVNLDLHFPSLPCSEVLVELTDASGREQLQFGDTLSKLRTNADGDAIGLPSKLDFRARAALGLRLSRFMHALHDALVGVLAFSLKAGCARDYSQPCPDRWVEQRDGIASMLGRHRCEAPSWYFGACSRLSDFDVYTPEDKAEWSLGCQANWPCLDDPGNGTSASPEAEPPTFDVPAAREIARRMLTRLREAMDAGGGADPLSDVAAVVAAVKADGLELKSRVERATLDVRAAVRPGVLTALTAVEVGERKARDEAVRHDALVRAAARAQAAVAAAAANGSNVTAAEDTNGAADQNSARAADAATHSAAAAAAAAASSAAWRVAIRPTEALVARLQGMGGEEARGYDSLRANLTAVLEEARALAPEEAQASSFVSAVGQMIAAVDGLAGGAQGEDRKALEQGLEHRLTAMLEALGLMRDGRAGEGCSLFGTISVPHVAGNLRIVPAHSSAMEQQAGLFGVLPSFSLRHALYFNVSHTVRHLSFGDYFPGKEYPLDGVNKLHMPGAAEVRYLVKVVACSHRSISGEVTRSSLFSATEHVRNLHWDSGPASLPGVFFAYDIAGQEVVFTERRGAGLLRSIARICALIGGVFTVTGILDSIVYRGFKQRLGKQS